MHRIVLTLTLAAASGGCEQLPVGDGTDASFGGGRVVADASLLVDAALATDLGAPSFDVGSPPQLDAGGPSDASSSSWSDAAQLPTREVAPGSHVDTVLGRVSLGMTRTEVQARLQSAGTRDGELEQRALRYNVSPEGLTVGFSDQGYNGGDQYEIGADDEVVWIRTRELTARTPGGVHLGMRRAQAENRLGPPGTEWSNAQGEGVTSFFTRGLILTYRSEGTVAALTVCRSYPSEPDGQLKLRDGALSFSGVELRGRDLGGTERAAVVSVLGTPDNEGLDVTRGSNVQHLAWTVIGIDLFLEADRLVYAELRHPYYGNVGTAPTSPGIGATRTEFESQLLADDFGLAQTSSATPTTHCYRNRTTRQLVGVTYSEDPESRVLSVAVAVPEARCP